MAEAQRERRKAHSLLIFLFFVDKISIVIIASNNRCEVLSPLSHDQILHALGVKTALKIISNKNSSTASGKFDIFKMLPLIKKLMSQIKISTQLVHNRFEEPAPGLECENTQ